MIEMNETLAPVFDLHVNVWMLWTGGASGQLLDWTYVCVNQLINQHIVRTLFESSTMRPVEPFLLFIFHTTNLPTSYTSYAMKGGKLLYLICITLLQRKAAPIQNILHSHHTWISFSYLIEISVEIYTQRLMTKKFSNHFFICTKWTNHFPRVALLDKQWGGCRGNMKQNVAAEPNRSSPWGACVMIYLHITLHHSTTWVSEWRGVCFVVLTASSSTETGISEESSAFQEVFSHRALHLVKLAVTWSPTLQHFLSAAWRSAVSLCESRAECFITAAGCNSGSGML